MNNIKHLSHPRGGVLKQRQRGLSMIELMIAITLSLILTTGIIQLFVSNKRANQLQQGTNSLQENGRYAMKLLIDSLHGADHWGGVEADEVGGSPALTGIGSCNTAWINNVAEGIRGYEGAAVSPLPNACIAAADYVPNSDVFVVRHAGGEYQSTAAVTGGAGSDAWVRSAVGRRARLFRRRISPVFPVTCTTPAIPMRWVCITTRTWCRPILYVPAAARPVRPVRPLTTTAAPFRPWRASAW